jgi:hypothetical protein
VNAFGNPGIQMAIHSEKPLAEKSLFFIGFRSGQFGASRFCARSTILFQENPFQFGNCPDGTTTVSNILWNRMNGRAGLILSLNRPPFEEHEGWGTRGNLDGFSIARWISLTSWGWGQEAFDRVSQLGITGVVLIDSE